MHVRISEDKFELHIKSTNLLQPNDTVRVSSIKFASLAIIISILDILKTAQVQRNLKFIYLIYKQWTRTPNIPEELRIYVCMYI